MSIRPDEMTYEQRVVVAEEGAFKFMDALADYTNLTAEEESDWWRHARTELLHVFQIYDAGRR